MAKIRVTQVRKGKKITFLTPDKGKPGKTPKKDRWYEPGVETGWEKDMPQGERRGLVLKAHKGDVLSSARSMQALANVTTDRETKRKARADAKHFFGLHSEIRTPTIEKILIQDVIKIRTSVNTLEERIVKAGPRETRDKRDLRLALEQKEKELEGAERRLIGKGINPITMERTTPIASRKSQRITPKTPRLRR